MGTLAVDRPFVGRAAELAAFCDHVRATERSDGRLVLISGEPGIGKSRFLAEALSGVPAHRVLRGRCEETEGAPAHWPWMQAFRRYVEHVAAARVRHDLAGAGAGVTRLLPPPWRAADHGRAPAEPESARFALFEETLAFLRSAAREEPLVIAFEDLHWADSESLLLLRFVANELGGTRLLIAATYREVELRQAAAVPRILGDLARVGHRLPLAPLTRAEVETYVAAALHETTPAPARAASIHRATGGNAYFVTELAELLAHGDRRDDAADGAFATPPALRDVVQRRLDALPATTRALLADAAILGVELDVAILAAMADLAPDAVLERLAPALALGVTAIVAEATARHRFAHAILRDAVLADLSPSVRADAHRRAAAAFERVHADGLDDVLGEIAHHLLEAGPLGTLPRAIDFSIRAGEHAFARLGYEEAAGHFERALQASRTTATAPTLRLRLLLALGRAQQATDDDDALATLTEAVELARALDDLASFATAATLAATAAERTGLPDAVVTRLLEEALARLDPDDSSARVALLAALARALYFVDRDGRRAYSDAALAMARRLDDRAALLVALQARRLALWEPGTAAERCRLGDEAQALAAEVGRPLALAEEYSWRIADHYELGDVRAVEDALRVYRRHVERFRLPRLRWHLALVEAGLDALAGRLDDAECLAFEAVSYCAPTPYNNVAAFLGVQLFVIYAEQGRLDEIASAVASGAAVGADPLAWRAAHAYLLGAVGQHDAARAALARLAADDFADFPLNASLLPTWAFLAELVALLDDAAVAARLLPRFARYADLNVVLAVGAGCLGAAARYVGLLARTAGVHDLAVAHFEAALAMNERIGAELQPRTLATTSRSRCGGGDGRKTASARRCCSIRRSGPPRASAWTRSRPGSRRNAPPRRRRPLRPPPRHRVRSRTPTSSASPRTSGALPVAARRCTSKTPRASPASWRSFASLGARSRRSRSRVPTTAAPATRGPYSTTRRGAPIGTASASSVPSSAKPRSSTTSAASSDSVPRSTRSRPSSRARPGSAAGSARPDRTRSGRVST